MRARLTLLAMCLFAACVSADTRDIAIAGERAPSSIIFVARRKWHIDVGFAVRDLSPPLASLARRFPGARYLFFGFGDQHYLLSKKQGAPSMLSAVLPGAGLMLVTAIENSPEQAFGAAYVLQIETAAAEARGAQSFVWRSFRGNEAATEAATEAAGTEASATLEPYAEGPYRDSLYFNAVPRYSALHTCNTWAAEALGAAGLRVRSRWVVFAGQLWRQARKMAARPSLASPAPLEGVPAPNGSRTSSRTDPALLQSQGGGFPF